MPESRYDGNSARSAEKLAEVALQPATHRLMGGRENNAGSQIADIK